MESGKRAVLVTGASRGIGAATAVLLAKRGYAVGVNYSQDGKGAGAVVDQIVATGGRAIALQANVADEAQVETLFETCIRRLGPLGGLVNNAAVLESQSRFEDMDLAR